MYEWLLVIHVLAAGVWLGSAVALVFIGRRALAAGPGPFGQFVLPATWWGGRAHPAAGLVLLLTGPGMVADADIGFGTTWVAIALVGLLLAFALGGTLVSKTASKLQRAVEAGSGDVPALGRKLLTYSALEASIIALVVIDMVVKPG